MCGSFISTLVEVNVNESSHSFMKSVCMYLDLYGAVRWIYG